MIRFLRLVLAGAGLTTLSACGWLFGGEGLMPTAPGTPDPSTANYLEAMAAFSECAASSDSAMRAAALDTLAGAEASMLADSAPRNPDHFFMLDRVRAGHGFCREAAGS